MAIAHWDSDRAAICSRIAAQREQRALLTLVLKTKDESVNLEPWLAHHGRVVGRENIIIMDNDSTDEAVLSTYRAAASAMVIFQFAGYFDLIHSLRFFPEFYAALEQRTRFFLFLDTDEYLVLIDERGRCMQDERVVYFLADHAQHTIFPCASFTNMLGHASRFRFAEPVSDLAFAVKWGKPVLATSLIPRLRTSDIIQHNSQMPLDLYDHESPTNLVLLHRSHVTAAQRVASNVRKLTAYGDVADADRTEVLSVRPQDLTIGRAYAIETQAYLRADSAVIDDAPGWFEISADGRLIFDAAEGEDTLLRYLRNPLRASEDLRFAGFPRLAPEPIPAPFRSASDDAALMIDEAIIYGRRMFVYGWAFSSAPSPEVAIWYGEQRIGFTRPNGVRPDVATAYQRPLNEPMGFALAWMLTPPDLGKAEHTITARLIDSEGQEFVQATRSFH